MHHPQPFQTLLGMYRRMRQAGAFAEVSQGPGRYIRSAHPAIKKSDEHTMVNEHWQNEM